MGGSGSGSTEAADVRGAAEVEAEANREAAQEELFGNRPDQYGPLGSTTWNSQMIDANTGRPIILNNEGNWIFADVGIGNQERPPPVDWSVRPGEDRAQAYDRQMREEAALHQYNNPGLASDSIDSVLSWEQNTVLNPEWQEVLDSRRGLLNDKTGYQAATIQDWQDNPVDWSGIGGDNLERTIGRSDLGGMEQHSSNLGAQDWRQFGTTDATIGANQWQALGNSDPTIGADDWRQFGTTAQTVNSGDWDARWGSSDQSGGFGDHGMTGSDWDQISYTPEAIRNQAEQQTLNFMNAQLDPQWDRKQEALEVQLRNQGLQVGDAAYDNAMESMKNSRSNAYSGARNQALADSRAEAAMLWDQEMGRSEQKNYQTQADIDNIYRARQANIQNYQGQRATDMQGYLAYQDAAFGQDLQSRQQQLNANLDYGRSAFDQDFRSRQQSLDAQLGYGREAWSQDFQGRQQQLDSNRLYSQEAFDQDYRSRQQNIANYLSFGNAEFDQNLSAQELELRRRQAEEALVLEQFRAADANNDINTIATALG